MEIDQIKTCPWREFKKVQGVGRLPQDNMGCIGFCSKKFQLLLFQKDHKSIPNWVFQMPHPS